MADPINKIIAVSNVYIKFMHFERHGDQTIEPCQTFDHVTLITSGKIRYELLDNLSGRILSSKIFNAPDTVFVTKNQCHKMVALTNNSSVACIHALRTIEDDIIPPDSIIEPWLSPDNKGLSRDYDSLNEFLKLQTDIELQKLEVPQLS